MGKRASAIAALAACLVVAPGGAAASPQTYGAHDAGGFRNVLTAGEAGVDNAAQLALFEGTDQRPAHWDDQRPLYENLLYASPALQPSQVSKYFKDATFGVRSGNVESTTSPKAGVTILRDKGYGVPHVYGVTRGDVMFGAGYAAAQDRLFLMDVLRHAARAQLSSFAGGAGENREMDRLVWQNLPYRASDLRSQIRNGIALYGAPGRRVIRDGRSYVAGVNNYIDQALADPTLLPSEYAAIGKLPAPWKLTDSIALAGLIGLEQGQGGGRELDAAQTLRAFERHFGRRSGRLAWLDFRERNDPEAPTTVARRFPYEAGDPFASRGLAIPDPGSLRRTPAGPPVAASVSSTTGDGFAANIGGELLRWIRGAPDESNALLVPAWNSTTGHPIAVMGPQVDYYVPEILMEEDLHGPGIDARGAAFPGVNQYVQLGHGRDYAWSATSTGADNVDTFAEVLCGDAHHYRYRGRCRPMQKLVRSNSWQPNLSDQTPAGSETLTVYRTVHGIVYARGRVHGKRVAFAHARTTYFHEADSGIGFAELNDPGYLRNARAFRRAVAKINFGFNWFYLDARHIAYRMSGWFPRLARATSSEFPLLGTGRYDWRGYRPRTHTLRLLPGRDHPAAVDPAFLVSWNNKPAPGWSAADDTWAWGPIYRSLLLSDKVAARTGGARRISPARLVQAMEESATQDLRARELLPILLRALGQPGDPALRAAQSRLRAWYRAGVHRRDLDKDGHDEHNGAIELFDAWWPNLVAAQFRPSLGRALYRKARTMIDVGSGVGGDSFSFGWWGYVSKDLRTLFGPRPRGVYSRIYCGGGSRSRCRAALRRSLRAALKVTPAQLYGRGDCKSDPEPACSDRDTWNVVSGIDEPAFPFQNRPTFQQVAEPRRRVGR
jgi:acyl-homoserine lactone acylase PvdQ